jgi:DNA-binding response OmpR family regulator
LDYASILVVDDDEMIVYFFKMILDELGFNVLEAFNGEDALKQTTSTQVDLVILDYKLSDMTGDIVAKQLKETNPQISIIFVTGYTEAKDKILRTNLSQHVVVKPIKENELIETVELVLSERPITMSV